METDFKVYLEGIIILFRVLYFGLDFGFKIAPRSLIGPHYELNHQLSVYINWVLSQGCPRGELNSSLTSRASNRYFP